MTLGIGQSLLFDPPCLPRAKGYWLGGASLSHNQGKSFPLLKACPHNANPAAFELKVGNSPSGNRKAGFSLLEIIGVLAVISILAALLIPNIFEAIHNAAIDQAGVSLNTIKTASVNHFAKFGCLAIDGYQSPPAHIVLDGSDARSSQFDHVLVTEGFLDKPFAVKIGDGILDGTHTRIQIVAADAAGTDPDGTNAAYDFDGEGAPNDATGIAVIEAVITDVTLEDARALNRILDGNSLGENPSGNDFRGRVKYAKPANSTGNANGTGNGTANGSGGNANGNGSGGNANGNGSGGNANGSGNGNANGTGSGNANGTGNGNANGTGNGNANGNGGHRSDTVDVHVYLTHR